MKDFDTSAKEGNPGAEWIRGSQGEEGAGVDKKGESSRSSLTDREKEKDRESRSLERILSYTIGVQVPPRSARHRKALKSPLKMTASRPARAGKVLGCRRWWWLQQHAAPDTAMVAVRVERKDNAIYFRLYSSSSILFSRSRTVRSGRGEAVKILRVFFLFPCPCPTPVFGPFFPVACLARSLSAPPPSSLTPICLSTRIF